MENLDTLFSTEIEVVEKLRTYAYKPDYKAIFFGHLGPELKKFFIIKKDKVVLKNFLEASQYEYGFFDKEIDLPKAFSLYKKYADINDYFCMYKMHVIYLCEYEKFNVPNSRILEKIYLLKCFAYLPNYIDDWNIKLFETIDVAFEITQILDLEDRNLEKHQLFFDLISQQKEKYNLSENDINLMKGVLFSHFTIEGSDLPVLSFCTMNSLIPENELDYAYYNAKNKSIFYDTLLKLDNVITDSEKEKFYKEIENKKLYEFYGDYGNYLLEKKIKANPEIIEIISDAANNGYIFNSYRAYQCLIDYYDFDEIMQDYTKASNILDYILDEVVFEKLSLGSFVLSMGFLIKYSKFPEKIISNYLIYVKEIDEYITSTIIKKEKENFELKDEEYYYAIKSYIYLFGFKDIEEQNLFKAIEYLDKGIGITKKFYVKKNFEFIKYKVKELLYSKKEISYDELIQAKKYLIELYYKELKLKNQIFDCYVIGEDFYEGITRKKDEYIALLIYNSTKNVFCRGIIDCFIKKDIKKFLKNNEDKIEKKSNDEICCICFTNKVNKVFIPCSHKFCDFCANLLEKNSKKCPVCRTEYFCII